MKILTLILVALAAVAAPALSASSPAPVYVAVPAPITGNGPQPIVTPSTVYAIVANLDKLSSDLVLKAMGARLLAIANPAQVQYYAGQAYAYETAAAQVREERERIMAALLAAIPAPVLPSPSLNRVHR